jgi:hypothetical protein
MTPKQATELILNSSIPFAFGGSKVWGADCVGLILLYQDLIGHPFPNEISIPRGHGTYEQFVKVLKRCNCVLDPDGPIVVERFIGSAHMGLCLNGLYVNQSNTIGSTEVKEMPSNIVRFGYLG